jgi:hypothetical protein
MSPVLKSKPEQDVAPRPPQRPRVESIAGPSVPQRKIKPEEDRDGDVDDEIRALRVSCTDVSLASFVNSLGTGKTTITREEAEQRKQRRPSETSN